MDCSQSQSVLTSSHYKQVKRANSPSVAHVPSLYIPSKYRRLHSPLPDPEPYAAWNQHSHYKNSIELVSKLPARPSRSRPDPFKAVTIHALKYATGQLCLTPPNLHSSQDIEICVTKPGFVSTIPIVIISRFNSIGCHDLAPGEHGFLHSLSPLLVDVLRIPCFRLVVREFKPGSRFERVKYYGDYTALLTDEDLPYDAWQTLPEQDRQNTIDFTYALQDGMISRDRIEQHIRREEIRLPLVLLQCKSFNRNFYTNLLRAEYKAVIPFAPSRRPGNNWRAIRQRYETDRLFGECPELDTRCRA